MADKKISALPPAATPLAGTEVLPLVQGGTTDKVSVANLTAGRAVSAASYSAVGNGAGGVQTLGTFNAAADAFSNSVELALEPLISGQSRTGIGAQREGVGTGAAVYLKAGGNEVLRGTVAGNISVATGNLVIGTAGKGIDFSANTHAPGMTSELLNWYEEGTWTPVISGSSTAGTEAGDKNATYTRIGNRVFARVSLIAYTLSGAAGNLLLTGLPFSARWNGIVAYTEGFTPAFTAAVGAGAALTLSTSTSSATTSVNFRPSVSTSWDNYLTASSVWTGGGGSTYMHIELWGSIV